MNHTKKILIIDDLAANIDILVNILGSENYEISAATSGQQALKLIQRDMPDLILLDVMMPNMSGYEVCEQLKQDVKTQHIPIIFVTAKADIDDMVKGFQLGAVDYLVKPIQHQEVLVRVNTHLQIQCLIQSEQKRNYELQQLNQQLQQQKEAAEEATALKDQFVSLVAHDLRSPFNAMLGYIKYLSDDDEQPLTDFQQEIVDKVLKSGYQQLAMIDEILNIGRLQSGKIMPQHAFLDVFSLVSMVIDKNIFLLEQKNIQANNKIEKYTRIWADSNLLIEVIHNLITNAVKFSHPNSSITFSTVAHDDEIVILVEDEGIGIPEEKLPHLFQLEKKTSTLGTAGEEGTGFGLPYCQNIMQAHHGKLSVSSQINQGSLFQVHLPKVKPNVLIVDDNSAFAKSLQALVTQQANVDATIASDGNAALQVLAKDTHHLIISDIKMPNMDGFELLINVRKDKVYKDIPFILITGEEARDARTRCFELGGDDYVSKPIQKDDLLPRIRRLIS